MKTFGATELSKMFECSRGTVYNKLKEESIQEFIVEEKGKKRLNNDGLKVFGHLIADIKTTNVQDNEQINTSVQVENTQEINTVTDRYIKSLESRIEALEKDKSQLKARESLLLDKLFEKDKLLIESKKTFTERFINTFRKNN